MFTFKGSDYKVSWGRLKGNNKIIQLEFLFIKNNMARRISITVYFLDKNI